MRTGRFLLTAGVTLTLLILGGFVAAQPGPDPKPGDAKPKDTKPGDPKPGDVKPDGVKPDGVKPPAAGQVQLDDKNFPKMLEELGLKVEARQNQDREPYWIVETLRDGWKFIVEVQPQRNKSTRQITGFWLISDLGDPINNPGGLSPAALLKLMEKSHELAPFFFTYNSATKHISMNYEYPFGTVEAGGLKNQFDTLFSKIRDTWVLWKAEALVATGGAPVVNANPNVNVNPNVPPFPPKLQVNPGGGGELAGSTWTGGENLQGYGKLTFKLNQGGTAVMIDADGATSGTWSHTAGKVYLAFYNGSVSYTGTIKNNMMSGTGNNGAQTWTFTLKRQ